MSSKPTVIGKSVARRVFSQLLGEVAQRSLRGSFLSGGAILLMSSLGAWQYLVSSVQAMDMRRAAEVATELPAERQVLVIAIDDSAYQQFFDARSPLRQDRVAELLRTVAEAAPKATRIAVDLDLAPHSDVVAAAQLSKVLRDHAPRWVLAAAAGATPQDEAQRLAWRQDLCTQGISFASPMVPTDFGHARVSHQYVGSLSDLAFKGKPACVDPAAPLRLQPKPLSPHTLKDGMVLPFSGDLPALAQTLQALKPQAIVLGGTWGKDDIFLTPFGDRYGLQVHAAAWAGRLNNDHQLPYWAQVLTAWGFVTTTALLMTLASDGMRRWTRAPEALKASLVGHKFFDERLRPLLLMALVVVLLLAMVRLLGSIWGHSGVWLPSSTVATVTLVAVVLIWNWGKNELVSYGGAHDAWEREFAGPVKAEWRGMRAAMAALLGRGQSAGLAALSKPRLLFEGLMALASLSLQTVLPFLSFLVAMTKPL